jgi:hypothetical protein
METPGKRFELFGFQMRRGLSIVECRQTKFLRETMDIRGEMDEVRSPFADMAEAEDVDSNGSDEDVAISSPVHHNASTIAKPYAPLSLSEVDKKVSTKPDIANTAKDSEDCEWTKSDVPHSPNVGDAIVDAVKTVVPESYLLAMMVSL